MWYSFMRAFASCCFPGSFHVNMNLMTIMGCLTYCRDWPSGPMLVQSWLLYAPPSMYPFLVAFTYRYVFHIAKEYLQWQIIIASGSYARNSKREEGEVSWVVLEYSDNLWHFICTVFVTGSRIFLIMTTWRMGWIMAWERRETWPLSHSLRLWQ